MVDTVPSREFAVCVQKGRIIVRNKQYEKECWKWKKTGPEDYFRSGRDLPEIVRLFFQSSCFLEFFSEYEITTFTRTLHMGEKTQKQRTNPHSHTNKSSTNISIPNYYILSTPIQNISLRTYCEVNSPLINLL